MLPFKVRRYNQRLAYSAARIQPPRKPITQASPISRVASRTASLAYRQRCLVHGTRLPCAAAANAETTTLNRSAGR